MKIQQLFDELEKIKETSKSTFEISGMVNRFKEMKYGFFPLGWGILNENNKTNDLAPTTEIEEGGIIVLGNDFGTVSYVDGYVNDGRKKIGEIDSKTINNLLNTKVGLDTDKTFFTNFYLGVRTHANATMTKRVEELRDNYKEICYKFFLTQLNLINPKIIICLGHDVRNALLESKESNLFINWKPKSITMKKLYERGENSYEINIESKDLGERKFIVIPHPCYIGNLKKGYMEKLNKILEDKGLSI